MILGPTEFEEALLKYIERSTGHLQRCSYEDHPWSHRTDQLKRKIVNVAVNIHWHPDYDPSGARLPLLVALRLVFHGDGERMARFINDDLGSNGESFLFDYIMDAMFTWKRGAVPASYYHSCILANVKQLLEIGCVLALPASAPSSNQRVAELMSALVFFAPDVDADGRDKAKRRCFRLLALHGQLGGILARSGRGLAINLFPHRASMVKPLYALSRSWVVSSNEACHHAECSYNPRHSMMSPLAVILEKGWWPVSRALMRRGAPVQHAFMYGTQPVDLPLPTSSFEHKLELFEHKLELLESWHLPKTELELFDSLYDGSPFQRLVLTLLLVRSHRLESAFSLLPNELLFLILMAVGHNYSALVPKPLRTR